MSTTPPHIATTLQAAGWQPVSPTNWQRPGPVPAEHSWPVADLIQRTDEPHHAPPPALAPKPPRPGFQMRGSNRPSRARVHALGSESSATCRFPQSSQPRPPGQPRKADLIRRVATMHDEQGKTFAAIAAEIGGKPSRAFYLYRQANKLQTATTH